MSVPLPGTIFFDMDDTILLYEAIADACWEQICRSFMHRLRGIEEHRLQASIKSSAEWYWSDEERGRRGRMDLLASRREIVARAFASLEVDPGGVGLEMADAFTVLREEAVEPIPGAIDTLRDLKGRGVRLALITNGNSRPQRAKIDRFGLEPFFENILIEGEFGVGKPHAQVYRHSLERLQADPASTWMVGDNLRADIGGAQALGIHSVWVDRLGNGLPENSAVHPDRIILRIQELVG